MLSTTNIWKLTSTSSIWLYEELIVSHIAQLVVFWNTLNITPLNQWLFSISKNFTTDFPTNFLMFQIKFVTCYYHENLMFLINRSFIQRILAFKHWKHSSKIWKFWVLSEQYKKYFRNSHIKIANYTFTFPKLNFIYAIISKLYYVSFV